MREGRVSAIAAKPLGTIHHIFIIHVLGSAEIFLRRSAQVFPASAEKLFEAVGTAVTGPRRHE
jgi:hypothetical protein